MTVRRMLSQGAKEFHDPFESVVDKNNEIVLYAPVSSHSCVNAWKGWPVVAPRPSSGNKSKGDPTHSHGEGALILRGVQYINLALLG